jgi:predicted SnoaL-like aldol condensation-catalyzing enzyme
MKEAIHLGAAACLQVLACDAGAAGHLLPSLAPPLSATGQSGVDVIAHPDPLSLLKDQDTSLAANKRLVFDMWRSIVNAGRVEMADEMLQEGYIQHSPVLPTGRAAFKAVFSAVKRREIPELVAPSLVTIIAEGDLVVMALRETFPEPGGNGQYSTTHFNLFRVEDGRLAEHWHSVQAPPPPNLPAAAAGGPQPVTGVSGAAQFSLLQAADGVLEANKRLVFDAWRHVIDAGREEMADLYFAQDFIDHDPKSGAGRQAFLARVAARADAPIQTSIPAPIVAIVAQGDLITLITGREHPHPVRKGETYTTTWFDMFRIERNRIAEHWNGAVKPGGPPVRYGD